ncbi:hypothetical protein RHMOL_Rhmol02G0191800 [Rhododendron molle]|uniref:Uncharacterized protein n=1 Tax=Rhododendron molle TaxID=49168 RepID=A0ACC0PRI6_RHOML|nr:hypothetical protein RHMOL_Rhmol02G0191800 [Rhododendron molle]
MDYLVDGTESELSVTFPKDADVAMMNLWEDEPGAGTNLWANTEVVNIKVGNEEWTVNKTVMEAERWKPEDLWDDLVIADLTANLQDTTIGNKRKTLADLWSEESKYRQIDHLTRSGRVYQPPNLQIGESSNPAAPGPSDPFTTPVENTFRPFDPPAKEPSRLEKNPEGMIKRQLEQTQAKMSVWNVLVHSTRHHEGLIQVLSQLKVPSAIIPDELVALIKTIPIKHAITFTDRDLPTEGTDHNRPLHITLKCHGKSVPVILVNNGSVINGLAAPTRHHGCALHTPSENPIRTETGMLIIHGNSGIHAHIEDNAPLLEIQHGEEDIALGGFSPDTSGSVYSVRIDEDFVVGNVAIKIMKKMSYMPGLGLGKNLQGPAKFKAQGTLVRTTGLGYSPSSSGKVKMGNRLEDYFVKEEAKQIYQGQPEPFWDKETNTFLLGFEIFANDVWPESEEEFEVVEEQKEPADWIEIFAMDSLATLFREDEPMGTAMEAEVLIMEQDTP